MPRPAERPPQVPLCSNRNVPAAAVWGSLFASVPGLQGWGLPVAGARLSLPASEVQNCKGLASGQQTWWWRGSPLLLLRLGSQGPVRASLGQPVPCGKQQLGRLGHVRHVWVPWRRAGVRGGGATWTYPQSPRTRVCHMCVRDAVYAYTPAHVSRLACVGLLLSTRPLPGGHPGQPPPSGLPWTRLARAGEPRRGADSGCVMEYGVPNVLGAPEAAAAGDSAPEAPWGPKGA